jgi:hypothetical protein
LTSIELTRGLGRRLGLGVFAREEPDGSHPVARLWHAASRRPLTSTIGVPQAEDLGRRGRGGRREWY